MEGPNYVVVDVHYPSGFLFYICLSFFLNWLRGYSYLFLSLDLSRFKQGLTPDLADQEQFFWLKSFFLLTGLEGM